MQDDRQNNQAPAGASGSAPQLLPAPAPGRRLLKLALRCLLLLLFLFTIYLCLGRAFVPLLSSQKAMVEDRVGALLGTEVRLGGLEGSWYRFGPALSLSELFILLQPDNPDTELALGSASLRLDPWRSLKQRQIALENVHLGQLTLALQQHSNGRWTLLGLEPGQYDLRNRILDLLLNTPSITVNDADVLLRLADGTELPFNSVYLNLDNEGSRHRLSLQFRLAGQTGPTLAVLELDGDPREEFRGQGWLSVNELELAGQVSTLLPQDWSLGRLGLSGQLWFDLDQQGPRAFVGQLRGLNLEAESRNDGAAPGDLQLSNAAVRFQGLPQQSDSGQGRDWTLEFRELAFDWHNSPWEIPALQLSLPAAATEVWRLRADSVEAAMLARIAGTLPLPERALDAIATLAPGGELNRVVLESQQDGAYPGRFQLRGNFSALSVESWSGAPAGSGLDGYFEARADGGFAELDDQDVTLFLPELFREPWHYRHLNARISWQIEPGELRVSSTPIHVDNEYLRGRVRFGLHNRRYSPQDFYSELSLAVALDHMDLARHGAYLPTLQRIENTMSWLDSALQDGNIVDSAFVLRTPLAGNTMPSTTMHASWYRVEQGSLRFLEDWPELQLAGTGVLVRDQSADIAGASALIAGLPVTDTRVRLRPDTQGSWLEVDTRSDAETPAAISFLRDTPVRDYVGAALDGWRSEGSLSVDVGLGIPLGDNPRQQQISVDAQSNGSVLQIDDYSLDIGDLRGLIRYRQDSGLQADALEAMLFGEPVSLSIETLPQQGRQASVIRVSGTGGSRIDALQRWPGQASFVRRLLDFGSGRLEYTARLDIPTNGGQSELRLSSDLRGVALDLPPPFEKLAGSSRPLQLDLQFNPTGQQVTLRYHDWLSGLLVLGDAGIDRGQLYFGTLNQSFNVRQSDRNAAGLLISGELDEFDFEAWQEVADRLAAGQGTAGAGTEGESLKDYLRIIDVDLGTLRVADQQLEDINVQVRYQDEAWQIYAENALLAGTLVLPDAGAEPWQVDLDYLRFPPRSDAAAGEQEEVDPLQDVDPSMLPAFSFRTEELSIGESNLGAWSFDFSPYDNGARITDLLMQEQASTISGPAENTGATIDWMFRNGRHRSSFEGVFASGDLSVVMPKWGHDANVVSRNSRFSGALSWTGSPLDFSLKTASGGITMAINDGRFVDIDSGSSRLLGAFNFDALVRRLELDFSDLYERGFSFDSIRGKLLFNDGIVQTDGTLVIDGPSSRLSINGAIDLARETIAADMQVRIPLGENISLLAGLLGAWPIAVSTYLASKIFSDQVEDFTTLIYRLEGPWSDPQAGFEAPDETQSAR